VLNDILCILNIFQELLEDHYRNKCMTFILNIEKLEKKDRKKK